LDTRIEHALLAGILPSWNHELSQYANNLKGLRALINNVITFSILPRNSRPATGQDEAWGRAKDRLRQERQMLDDEINKIIKIRVSLAHGRGEYDEVGVDLIRTTCQDITSPARSRTSQKVGDTILDILKDNQSERLHEILAGPEPEAYVAAKVSGFPTFKAFFSSDEYKKYLTTQKTR
jgi:hypothetical protein